MATKHHGKQIFQSIEVNGDLTASGYLTGEVDAITSTGNTDLSLKTGTTPVKQFAVKHVTGTIVNNLAAKGAAASAEPELIAEGSDTDIDIKLTPKGAGVVAPTTVKATNGVQSAAVSVTATADGLTTGLIPSNASVVAVTSDDAAKIVTLPAAVVGMRMMIILGATGCELRTPASSNVKINDVDSDGSNQCALAADSHFEAFCVSSTEWIVYGWDSEGAALAALVPDAPA